MLLAEEESVSPMSENQEPEKPVETAVLTLTEQQLVMPVLEVLILEGYLGVAYELKLYRSPKPWHQ
jgi:hypothetical protein